MSFEVKNTKMDRKNNNLHSIQILRDLAALSVVYFHMTLVEKSSPFPKFGSYGVDIFFVISGFIISLIVSNGVKPVEFAINRIARIAPLYWILTTILLLLSAARPELLNSTSFNLINYTKSLFFIPYFKENGQLNPVLAVGWTLNYEMFFYLCIFISLCLKFSFYLFITILIFVSLFFISKIADNITFSTFFSEKLIFEFIFGMLSFELYKIIKNKNIPIFVLLAFCLTSFIFMSIVESHGIKNRLFFLEYHQFLYSSLF